MIIHRWPIGAPHGVHYR